MVCTSIHYCNIKLTFNGPVKYVLPLKIGYFLFLLCHSGVFLFSTRLYIQEGDLFLC